MFGEWSIDKELFEWMQNNIEPDSILLELGSGNATEKLCENWNVYSIEQNKEWVGKYKSNYIHAPLVDGWYNLKTIKKGLPKKVDAILIDGPAGGRRMGFFENIDTFLSLNPKTLIFDDINRQKDLEAFESVKDFFNKKNMNFETEKIQNEKTFGVIKLIGE